MSERIRGREVEVKVSVDGQLKDGFIKLNDFRVTPRTEIVEKGYLGEALDDLDVDHRGYDISFSIDNEDAESLDFMNILADRDKNGQRPQNVTLTALFRYRKAGERDRGVVCANVFLKVDEISMGSRADYVQTQFSGKCKEIQLISA